MRMIYVDEAGMRVEDPHRVVVGVLVKSSEQWRAADLAMRGLVERHVPEPLQSAFIFHATDIFSGNKRFKEVGWSLQSRIDFFCDFLQLPRALGIPVAIGAVAANRSGFPPPFTPMQADHIMAFMMMLQGVDRVMRKEGTSDLAAVVCEQIPDRQRHLRAALKIMQESVLAMTPAHYGNDKIRMGDQHPENFRVTAEHIIDTVHFCEKPDARMMQLADACAYVIRRALARLDHTERLLKSLLLASELPNHWANPATSMVLNV